MTLVVTAIASVRLRNSFPVQQRPLLGGEGVIDEADDQRGPISAGTKSTRGAEGLLLTGAGDAPQEEGQAGDSMTRPSQSMVGRSPVSSFLRANHA